MASNTELNAGTGGDILTTKERTHDGDATKSQVITIAGVSGTEGSYTFKDIDGSVANGLEVDVTRIVPGTGATNLGKSEDVAHASGDVGVMALAVRSDTLAALGANGDYTPQQTDNLGATYQNQGNRISTTSFNSRDAATLLASATFQGVGEDVSKYGRVGVSIVSDNATDGVLTMEVSRDDVTYGGPTRTWADTRFAQPHMWNIVEKFFRIKYVNGTTEATNLAIQVQYSNNADILLGHQLDETLLNEVEAIVTRSVTVGQDPNDVYLNAEQSGVDNDNSSTTNLTAATSLVFTGSFHNISGYAGISVLIDGTSGGAVTGTLQMQFSHDGSTIHRDISVTTEDVRDTLPRTLGVVAKFFRIIFTADADLTSFQAQTMLHTQQVFLVSRLDGTLQGNEDVTNVRSVLVGKTAGGSFVNVGATNGGSIKQDLTEINGTAPDVNSGNGGSGTLRVTIATDDVNQAAINTATVAMNAKMVTGTVIGDVNLGATDNAVLDDIAAKLAPNTTNGHTPYLNQDTSAIATVKGSAGTIYWLSIQSIDATPVYLNLYDSTTATLGSTTPTNQFIVPTQGDANGSGLTINFGQLGIQYGTGIQVAAATTFGGSTDPGTNVVITNIGYE